MIQQLKILRRIPALKQLIGGDRRLHRIRVRRIQRHEIQREIKTRHAARVDIELASPREALVDLVARYCARYVHRPRLRHLEDCAQVHHVVYHVCVVLMRDAAACCRGAEAEGCAVGQRGG